MDDNPMESHPMDGDPMPPGTVRPARAEEFGLLRSIELSADRLFEQVGIGPLPVDEVHNRLHLADAVFAAQEPAVGFVSIEVVDGEAHIELLAVLPEFGRRGLGRALVDEAIRWARAAGLAGVTLTTFRDVPWNAPFYRRIGFDVVTDPGPGLAARRHDEQAEGLDQFGPRVAMRLPL